MFFVRRISQQLVRTMPIASVAPPTTVVTPLFRSATLPHVVAIAIAAQQRRWITVHSSTDTTPTTKGNSMDLTNGTQQPTMPTMPPTKKQKKKKQKKEAVLDLTPEEIALEQLARKGDVDSQHRFGMLFLAKAKGKELRHPALANDTSDTTSDTTQAMMQEEEHEEAARAKQKAEAVMSEIRAQQRSNQKVRRRVVKDAKASGASRTQGDTMTALITELDVKANSMRMKGVEWLLKAHQQGYASSTVALANVMYENIQNGQGSIDQLKKVITLWSSVSPHPDACFNLGKLYYDGIPSISEFETNKGVSFEWFQSAAQEGDAASQYWLGYMHHVGDEECGVVPNRDVALMMLKSASDQRHIDASIYLYTLYRNGDSAIEVDASDSKALHYLHVAKEQGSDEAYNVLGDLYFHGTEMGIDVNLTESLKSYLKSGELGNSFALCSAAAMYHHGYGAERDWIKSYQLYQLAVDCDSDNKEAWRNLASCYYYGHGTKQDVELAKTILNTVLKKDEIKA